jgi:hypothetical protein
MEERILFQADDVKHKQATYLHGECDQGSKDTARDAGVPISGVLREAVDKPFCLLDCR